MTCSLCGHRFEKEEAYCHSACPLNNTCGLMCCPRCRYPYVGESSTLRFLKRLVRGVHRTVGGKP